jgi:hypothetical protein
MPRNSPVLLVAPPPPHTHPPSTHTPSSCPGFQPDTFLKTLSDYSAAAEVGIDSFQKSTFPVSFFDPNEVLFVAQITPVIHYTLGGIQVGQSAVRW